MSRSNSATGTDGERLRWRILEVVKHTPPSQQLNVRDIADRLASDVNSVTEELQRLHEQGFVSLDRNVARSQSRPVVFVGHGHATDWRDLRDFLLEIGLAVEEFNRVSVAGISAKERLEQMLDAVAFAFLVVTGDDVTADGKVRPRDNVIHEIGLFQGRLGFENAIILLEKGCPVFSNIHGLQTIEFPRGNLRNKTEDIRGVLRRQGIPMLA